jgi:hypothetical protein
MESGAWSLVELVDNFSSIFSAPSLSNFTALVRGWVLCVGARTISPVIQLGDFSDEQRRHHSVLYRLLSRAKWVADELGACIFRLVLRLIPDGLPVVLVVDDTLCRKGGAHIWGAAMHHDPLLSNYGRGKSAVKFFSFGHNWVIVCACLPLPWNRERVIAIPIAFRLYRSKKRCPCQVAQSFSQRWSQEQMHYNVKQHLGLEEPQNGWWRRVAGRRRDPRVAGPQPHALRGKLAVTRTVPFVLTTYGIVVLWYFANGDPQQDVERVRRRAPWYRHKTQPSFGDMLAALRRHLWAARNIRQPSDNQGSAKIDAVSNAALQELVSAAA